MEGGKSTLMFPLFPQILRHHALLGEGGGLQVLLLQVLGGEEHQLAADGLQLAPHRARPEGLHQRPHPGLQLAAGAQRGDAVGRDHREVVL